MAVAEMGFKDWVALVASVLTICGILLSLLWWAIRAEMRPSLQRLSIATDHLATAINTASIALTHAAERIENHETRIAVLESKSPTRRRRE